ncbi:MAG TPA: B12-binding domain-containing protein [Pyrinomonadaceae bacterium]|nr:B12-binding domain-containing protein [Pyrinomonadaceae bacterium]
MAGTALTTKEVARLLSVSEATIKRWADDGLIQSDKTVGGHRRFGLAGIARFQRERGAAPQRIAAQGARKPASKEKVSTSLLFQHLIAGHEDETGALLIHAYLHGTSLASLFDRVITPAMHQIGDLWYRGEVTIADEHLATQTAIAALQKLRGLIHLAAPSELKALICGVEGDLHELPIHLSQVLLESDGWDVINLGPNTPFFAVAEALTKHRPRLLCISAKLMTDPDRLARDYAQVLKAASKLGGAIVLGGDGFADSLLSQRFPSEFYAKNFEQLLSFTRSLAPTDAQ